MAMWNPWRGCHKYSEGCKFCYIHKGDSKRGVDTNKIIKTSNFIAPIEKNKKGEYKIKAGQTVYLCFSSDFLIEEADAWRTECWQMIKERSDVHFIFLTKRIERFMECIPTDWNDLDTLNSLEDSNPLPSTISLNPSNDLNPLLSLESPKLGYDNVTVGCTIENQESTDYRLSIFSKLPIKHKNIICQPLIESIDIEKYLDGVDLVVVGGESDYNARPLDFDWVLSIREQCINQNTRFEFRQCGTHFIKEGKSYTLNVRQLCSQAKKANINKS